MQQQTFDLRMDKDSHLVPLPDQPPPPVLVHALESASGGGVAVGRFDSYLPPVRT